jgi:transposase
VTRKSPYVLALTAEQHRELEARARRYTLPYRDVVRAKIVLMAAQGLGNEEIATRLDTNRAIVSKWRKRFFEQGLPGLEERPRGGRPPVFPPEVVVAVKSLACELPSRPGVPLSRFHVPGLREEAIERGIVAGISGKTIWRWLAEDAIKPWRHRSWIFPRDPGFEAKAGRVLDLYAREWEGKPLGEGDFVLSSDEKTSIQARVRCHHSLAPAPRRAMRAEHEYERAGALQYLAAWDIHRAKIFGRCEPATGIEPFGRLVSQVMDIEPCASARRVFWVVDNGSSHRGNAACQRLTSRWPNARLVQLPIRASWLNMVEVFSVLQRKVLTPNDFADLGEVESRLAAFERRYEHAAEPFEWKFTRDDLAELIKKLAGKPDYLAA